METNSNLFSRDVVFKLRSALLILDPSVEPEAKLT